MNKNSRARNWRFTEHKPEGTLHDLMEEFLIPNGIVEYCVYQLETYDDDDDPDKVNEHFQGLIVFKKQLRRAAVSKILPRANLDVCFSPIDMRNYCMKGDGMKKGSYRLDGPFEHGIWHPPEEKLNVWNHIKDELAIKPFIEVALANPGMYARYDRGMKALHSLMQKQRDFKTYITLIIGPPGVGKTKQIYDVEKDLYSKPHSEWWDGYFNQTAVLFDDFYGYIKYSELLTILDRYPVQVPFKGGYSQFNSKRLYITSNVWPHKWYKSIMEHVDFIALLRRIDKVIYWDEINDVFITVVEPLEFLKIRCI